MAGRHKRRRRRRQRIVMAWLMGAGTLTALLLLGSAFSRSDRADVTLQRARIAVAHAKPEQALGFANDVLGDRPGDANARAIRAEAQMMLLQRKGQRLIEMGCADEAVKVYRRGAMIAPDNAKTWHGLARACLVAHDYPSAETALQRMGKIDQSDQSTALAELGQMYARLGLRRQTEVAFEALMQQGEPLSASHVASMGRAFEVLGRLDLARRCLSEIPASAKEYAAAQVLLARIERRDGQLDEAKQRLRRLTRVPHLLAAAARALARLNIYNEQDSDLIRWCDTNLGVEKLPEALRPRWLRFRVGLAANDGRWRAALGSLDQLAELEPKSIGVNGARIAILASLGETDNARQVFRSRPELATSGIGPLSALVAGVSPTSAETGTPHRARPTGLPAFLGAMIRGDVGAARSALRGVAAHPTIYRSDLSAYLDQAERDPSEVGEACRQLAIALLASLSGLPQLCGELSRQVIRRHPDMVVGYSLCALARLDCGQSVEPLLDRVRKMLPSSGLTAYLAAKQKDDRADYADAVADLRALVRREPDNIHLRHTLSCLYRKAGLVHQALAILDELRTTPGPYQVSAANSVAYLLAEHHPGRLDQVYRVVGEALRRAPASKGVLDTFGWIEHLRGEHQRAVKLLSLAVYGPNPNAEAHFHLGVAYSSLGNATWARYHLQQAIDLSRDVDLSDRASALLADCGEQATQTGGASLVRKGGRLAS